MLEQSAVEVKNCPHGKGVFALKEFKQGEVISTVSGGRIVSHKETVYDAPIGNGLFWSEIKEGKYIWSNFLDHSSKPNARFINFNPHIPSADLVATSNIKSGEEIFLNCSEIEKRIRDKSI